MEPDPFHTHPSGGLAYLNSIQLLRPMTFSCLAINQQNSMSHTWVRVPYLSTPSISSNFSSTQSHASSNLPFHYQFPLTQTITDKTPSGQVRSVVSTITTQPSMIWPKLPFPRTSLLPTPDLNSDPLSPCYNLTNQLSTLTVYVSGQSPTTLH